MDYSVDKRNQFIEYSLYLGCILSNISQLPVFVRAELTQRIALPGWGLLVFAIILSKRVTIYRKALTQLGLGLLLVLWLLFDSIALSEIQFKSSMFYSYIISLIIFFLGTWSSEYVDARVLKNINTVYIISVIIVTFSIFIEYFGIGYSLTTRLYAYNSKNSISQIIFTAIILLIVRFKPERAAGWIMKTLLLAFELYVLLLLRSRATFVSLILCVLILVLGRNTNKRIKTAIAVVGIALIALLIISSRFNNFIFNQVLFAGRDTSNLNDLTSGRISMLDRFPQKISGHWITGIGPYYYDCFPLSAILQFGLFGGLIVIIISLQPLWISFKNRRVSNEWDLLFLIAIGYSVNGLFEGLTPFGPGVKCYYMWLLFGFMISRSNYRMNKEIQYS